ncbi:nadh-ubiquinone oxidoreductase kda subunit [Fusarium subglutinans]|uniref:Nadh-ubiquinone oxidoreductase kDa subunit n=1 Tax=Gibberella subglutinans TaxID=42677 RepID=A0A8H5LDS2_GIBSU|nr:nadh-ubiquinone oxidoreductase kda subunit [Fusarium subglutinans]KAF5589203.1 nadh-ubiquinone oxidoreductase kda subunit [Fusarium subglutinans]
MFAARQRVAGVARQLQRTARTYASDAHAHHKAPEVNESFSTGSLLAVGSFFGSVLVYQFVPQEGEQSSILSLIDKYTSRGKDWEDINALHTKAMEQAGYDRNLFENGGNKHRFVDVAYPEAMTSYAPRNNVAGHLANMDYVVEHYRQKHIREEERKAAKLAQKEEYNMTASQSGQSDTEPLLQQPCPGEQAPEDMNTANLSSNPRQVPVSTKGEKSPPATSPHEVKLERDIKACLRKGSRRKVGVFACRDLPHGHEIIGANRPIFVAPDVSRELPEALFAHHRNTIANLNAIIHVCVDKFKRDHAIEEPWVTLAVVESLAIHMNHACQDCAQGTFLVADTYDITVTLVKDVRAGEEIFIDLGEAGSHLACPLCSPKESIWKRRKRQLKRFLAKLYPRNMLKTAEPPSE